MGIPYNNPGIFMLGLYVIDTFSENSIRIVPHYTKKKNYQLIIMLTIDRILTGGE